MGKKYIVIGSLLACIFLYIVEQVLAVDYVTKTLVKIVLFTLLPYVYIRFLRKAESEDAIKDVESRKLHIKLGLLFGTASFVVILAVYFLLQDVINLQGIMDELQSKSKITPGNFLLIGLYITFGNSFLEEFFFRGFIFLNLYEMKSPKLAYIYSSVLFGVYHIAIFKTWFSPWLTGLALLGLVSIGFVFDWLDTKSNNFINSWIVHILADTAIILIGMRMFGMI